MKYFILLFLINFSLFAEKMPGEYFKGNQINEILKDVKFRGDNKSGNYEVYSIVNSPVKVKEMKFLIINDEKTAKKWFELYVDTTIRGEVALKLMTDGGLLEGKLERMQIKYSKYYPFELDLTKNGYVNKDISQGFIKNKEQKILKESKFVKNDFVRIDGKRYKVKVYRVKNEKYDITYAVLDPKDTKIWGLAYLKVKDGVSMYLKKMGSNGVSIFPRKVPKIDFIDKISKMSEEYFKREEMRKKALEREKQLEAEGKENEEDPIEKLNKMIEEEGN